VLTYDGGKLKKITTHSIHANVNDMQVAEDMHMVFTHLMMKVLRKTLTGSEAYC
jgi:D-sedoheptulose 7-phosphate isomerase